MHPNIRMKSRDVQNNRQTPLDIGLRFRVVGCIEK